MTSKEKNVLSKSFACFAVMMALRLLEEFFIVPNIRATKAMVCCIGGFLFLFAYLRIRNQSFESIGLRFNAHKLRKGFLLALVLNVIVTVVTFGGEYLVRLLTGGYANVAIYYDDVSLAYSAIGASEYVLWMVIGIVLSLFHAIFYELFFRGLLMSQGSQIYSFGKVNALQALGYTAFFLVPVVRVVIANGSSMGTRQIVILLAFTVVYEIITALKLGLMRFSTGALWCGILDHWAFDFLTDTIHIQYDAASVVDSNNAYYLRMLLFQGLGLVITYLYYRNKRKKLEEEKKNRKRRQSSKI